MNKPEDHRKLRRQADVVGVRALSDLLRDIAAKPLKYLEDTALHSALRSQGALAKYALPSASIPAMSLNHQRVIAELALGSYETLDLLRRCAKDALIEERLRAKRGNARNKEGLLARVRELECDNALLKQDLAILQRAYDLRCVQARVYAAAAGSDTQALCAKEQKELDASFSLRRKPIESSNVVDIGALRDRVQQKS